VARSLIAHPVLFMAGMAGVAGIVAGLTLLVTPRRLLDQPSPLRRILLEANVGDWFNRSITIEKRVYRRHRAFGALVLAGSVAAAAMCWYFAFNPGALPLYGVLGRVGARVVLLVVAAAAVGLWLAGLCLVIRPSVLKGIEAAANRWIEPMPAGNVHTHVARAVARAPRLAGVILVLSGLVCLRIF
jgi:hypothetical protein